jgi:phosphoglycerate dehydrogenase-like enzyme
MRVLITCPPMLRMMESFEHFFSDKEVGIYCPNVVQTLTDSELKELVPHYEGWIIGDDPATREVFETGKQGRLRAAVKWGIGTDNVDLQAAKDLGIPISNIPNMFGKEVADLAMSYITALARESFFIDREVRSGRWPKPCGISLAGTTVALVGYGDIGKNLAKRLLAADMHVIAYDPVVQSSGFSGELTHAVWPDKIEEADFIVFTCSLTRDNYHMLNPEILSAVRKGVRVVNVARGPLIDESALIKALQSGVVHSAALDVMEAEPLPADSPLLDFKKCIFGSHNASNTREAVKRTSERAIQVLFDFLGVK